MRLTLSSFALAVHDLVRVTGLSCGSATENELRSLFAHDGTAERENIINRDTGRPTRTRHALKSRLGGR
jgi:hypothetical protein